MVKNIFKPLGESAINLKNNAFLKAKIKLTLYYTAILFIVIIVFSIFIYMFFISYISADLKADTEISQFQETKMLQMAMTRLKTILIFSDIGILILISGMSYFLAGKTLKPIERSLEDQKRFAELIESIVFSSRLFL